MGQPLVSIIVPIYNLQPYLDRSLTSLLHQDYQNLQFILVDDASSDDSAEVIQRFAAKDARVLPIYQPVNAGVSAARNAGLEQASGLYVAFMDGDDWLDPYFISQFVTCLEQGPYDLVVSPYFVDNPEPKAPHRFQQVSKILSRKQFLRGMLQPAGQVRGYLWNKFYRRSVIESAHLRFDESVAIMEDELFTTTYAMLTSRFYYLGTPAYHHVVRPDSATQSLGVIGAIPQQLSALWQIQQLIRGSKKVVVEEPVVKTDR